MHGGPTEEHRRPVRTGWRWKCTRWREIAKMPHSIYVCMPCPHPYTYSKAIFIYSSHRQRQWIHIYSSEVQNNIEEKENKKKIGGIWLKVNGVFAGTCELFARKTETDSGTKRKADFEFSITSANTNCSSNLSNPNQFFFFAINSFSKNMMSAPANLFNFHKPKRSAIHVNFGPVTGTFEIKDFRH